MDFNCGSWKVIENYVYGENCQESILLGNKNGRRGTIKKRKGNKKQMHIVTAHLALICKLFIMENLKRSWKVMEF